MNSYLENALHIRYTKLKFTLIMQEDCLLSEHKASAIRGGIGEMLLRANCIRDRQCQSCDFEDECIVQRVMYSRYDIQPAFVSSGDSIGYIISCETKKRRFQAGDTFSFYLTLFGKNIVYFHQYVNAIYALGMQGLGAEKAKFQILKITNDQGEEILQGPNIYMEKYRVKYVDEYVHSRMEELFSHTRNTRIFIDNAASGAGENNEDYSLERQYLLKLLSPLCLKYQGEFLKYLEADAIYKAILRRIYMMDCFEGIENEIDVREFLPNSLPVIEQQNIEQIHVPRYSNRKRERIVFHGIEGEAVIQLTEEDLAVFLAGELLQIGKNTSFGFGRYRLENIYEEIK